MRDMLSIANKIKHNYEISQLSEHQFKVLLGLVTHNDIEGAIKGLNKILRRNKNRGKG